MKTDLFEGKIARESACEVLVVGGGVAGISAALCAAEAGADVILAEQLGYLGGCATAGLVAPFMTSYDRQGKVMLIRGVFRRFVDRMIAAGGAIDPSECMDCGSHASYKLRGHLGVTPFDTEIFKTVAEQMCAEAGVRLRYQYHFVGAEKSDGRTVSACVFSTTAGLCRVRAKAVIDCTGNADVCASAGGETFFSDGEGHLQSVSTFFTVDGVDKARLDAICLAPENTPDAETPLSEIVNMEGRRAFTAEIRAARENGEFPCNTRKVRAFEQLNGIWHINMCQIDRYFDVTDPDLLTEAAIEGRRQAWDIFRFLKARVPGFENIRLLQTSGIVGVRESRRIAGEYILTLDDVLASRQFADRIAVLSNSVDVHTTGRTDYRPNTNDAPYSIPYRSLVHRDFDNVWSAGKTVSADRFALGAIRVMPPSMAMGQAAGAAAAIAAKKGVAARDVPYADLKAELLRGGAYLPENG